MANNKIFLLFFLHLFFYSHSQNKNSYDFVGGLLLNGSNEEFVSYKINFTEENGLIKGFSITDLGGDHETKNSLIGKYDKAKKTLTFREDAIIYTKSTLKKTAFCYVNYSGKMSLNASNPKINDIFKGLYKNDTKCIDGKIQMIGSKKIMQLATKINNKIQKSKKIDAKTKEKVNPLRTLDSLSLNILKESKNLQMFTKDKQISFDISDQGAEDGDMITIYVDGKIILENYTVVKKNKIIDIPIVNKTTVIEVEAINEGDYAPNTSNVVVKDSNNTLKTITKLSKGKKTMITIESEK